MAVNNGVDFGTNINVKLQGIEEANKKIKDFVKSIENLSENASKSLNNLFAAFGTAKSSNYSQKSLSNLEKKAKDFYGTLDSNNKKIISSNNVLAKTFTNLGVKIDENTKRGRQMFNMFSTGFEGFNNKLGNLLTYYTAFAAIDFTKGMIKSLDDLQASFANIQAITASTDNQMRELTQSVFQVATATRYSTQEISDATTVLGQAGLTTKQIQGTLKATATLASATGTSVAETANNMTSVMAVWNKTTDQSVHIADTFVTAINRTKATMQTMSQTIQYAGAQLSQMGVSFEETIAVAAATANAGMKVRSMIGTGMRNLVTELEAPTKRVTEGLAKFGLTADDVSVQTYGLIGAIQKLKDAGIDGSNAFEIFNKRSATFYAAASSQLDVMSKLQRAFSEEGAAARANETQMNTLNAQFIVLRQTIERLLYNAFSPLIEIMTASLKIFNKTLGLINDLDELMNGWLSDIAGAVVAGGILSIFIDKIKLLSALFKSLSVSIGIAGAAGTSLFAKLGKFGAILATLFDWLKKILSLFSKLKVGVISAVITGFTLLYNIFKRYGSDTGLEKATSSLQEYSDMLSSVNDNIDELSKKEDYYTKHQDALDVRIIELNKQYDSMRESIAKLGGDYDNLSDINIRLGESFDSVREKVKLMKAEILKGESEGYRRKSEEIMKQYQPGVFGAITLDKRRNIAGAKEFYGKLSAGKTVEERDSIFRDIYNSIDDSNLSDKMKKTLHKTLEDVYEAVNDKITADMKSAEETLIRSGKGTLTGADSIVSDLTNKEVEILKSVGNSTLESLEEFNKITISKQNELANNFITAAEEIFDTAGVIEEYRDNIENYKKAIEEGNKEEAKKQYDEIAKGLKETGTEQSSKLLGDYRGYFKDISKIFKEYGEYVVKMLEQEAKKSKKEGDVTKSTQLKSDIEQAQDMLSQQDEVTLEVEDTPESIMKRNIDKAKNETKFAQRPVSEKVDSWLKKESDVIKSINKDYEKFQARQKGTQSRWDRIGYTGEAREYGNMLLGYAGDIKNIQRYQALYNEREAMKSRYGDLYKRYESGTLSYADEHDPNRNNAINQFRTLDTQLEQLEGQYGLRGGEGAVEAIKQIKEKIKEIEPLYDSLNSKNPFERLAGQFSYYIQPVDDKIKSYLSDWGNLFDDLGKNIASSLNSGMTEAADAIWNGEKSVGEAFRDMGENILRSMGQFITQVLVQAAVMAALNAIPGMSALLKAGDSFAMIEKSAEAAKLTSLVNGLKGQVTQKKAAGGYVSGGVPNRDSVHAMLMPGEYVMKKKAVDTLGTNFLNDLNRNADQTMNNLNKPANTIVEKESEPAVTNVWVVADRNDAKMGPNDVIATISRDILQGGQTKKLIQSVVSGRK